MPYVLRFVQRYRPADRKAFMDLEAQFAAMERSRSDFPRGRRSQPYSGREPTCTLIWECQFATLAEAQAGLAKIEADPRHEELLRKQIGLMEEAWTEIYELLEL